MTKQLEKYKEVAMKSLAVLGLMTILAGGSFLTLTALTYVPKIALSIGRGASYTTASLMSLLRSEEKLSLSANKTSIGSGDSLLLSLTHKNKKSEGSYSIYFPCVAGVSVNRAGAPLFCNTENNLEQETKDLSLLVSSKKVRTVNVPFSLRFKENGESKTSFSSKIDITLSNMSIVEVKEESQAKETKTVASKNLFVSPAGQTPSKPSQVASVGTITEIGKADMRPVIAAAGIIDPVSKAFVPTTTMSRASKIAIKFAIENIGTKTSAPWVFNAVLPTAPSHTYLPEVQPPLKPGERIEFTLSFDRAVEGDSSIKISVDPAGALEEATRTNNSASINIKTF